MDNLTGIILTHNNEKTIIDSLSSMADLVSELIIVDDFSTDQTLDIIKSNYPTARIVKRKLTRFDQQRNYALGLAKYDWIIMIDSDEIITADLARSISLLTPSEGIDGYWVVRLNKIFSSYLAENNPDKILLFRRQLKFINPVHEALAIDHNRTEKLAGLLKHEGWVGMFEDVNKMNKYSDLIARKWFEQKRHYNNFQLFVLSLALPLVYLFDCLFKKGYYRLGLSGWLYSIYGAMSWPIIILKYKELQENN